MNLAIALLASLPVIVAAQSCAAPSPSGKIQPSVASGYQWQVVATGLSNPRGIILDSAGNLLVAEAGTGRVSVHVLNDQNGCVTVSKSSNVTQNMTLNHGIEMSGDGKTLYASSTEAAYSWDYDSSSLTGSNMKTLVTNMTTSDHTTRTLLLSKIAQGILFVTRGSTSNIDIQATQLSTGHSQVKSFNLTSFNGTAFNFNDDGILIGWGLRNDVGIAEHSTSGLYSVENSADQVTRMGQDVHQDNPAEKLNFLGYTNGSQSPPGAYGSTGDNYGYPWCFAAWDPSALPSPSNLTVGSLFAVDASSDTNGTNKTDQYCAGQAPPRLSFQAHMAPLDIKFNNSGTEGWITWHGSWDRTDPVGYKMSVVSFGGDGLPMEPPNSTTAAFDVFANKDNSQCPDNCFRPATMAIDSMGRIFMSSDTSGEIYMVSKVANSSGSSGGSMSSRAAANALSSPFGDMYNGAWGYLGAIVTVFLGLFL